MLSDEELIEKMAGMKPDHVKQLLHVIFHTPEGRNLPDDDVRALIDEHRRETPGFDRKAASAALRAIQRGPEAPRDMQGRPGFSPIARLGVPVPAKADLRGRNGR